MEHYVGLWVDSFKAVIVFPGEQSDLTREVRSNIETQIRFSPDSYSMSPEQALEFSLEGMHNDQCEKFMNRYFDGIIAYIRCSDSIWIFGPDEAKYELQKRLEGEGLAGRIISIDPADKMNDRQVTVRVHEMFRGDEPFSQANSTISLDMSNGVI